VSFQRQLELFPLGIRLHPDFYDELEVVETSSVVGGVMVRVRELPAWQPPLEEVRHPLLCGSDD
jgi:hypothetical protein